MVNLHNPPEPWWVTDSYDQSVQVPEQVNDYAGPHGIAFVRLYQRKLDDGEPAVFTDRGWGLTSKTGGAAFMHKYTRGSFSELLKVNLESPWPFAFVMRSLNLVCVDIDGKNGGDRTAIRILGRSEPTLTERSKSGKGWHMFYALPDSWSDTEGFALIKDHIGFDTGIDIRGTGCVYHYPHQQWNGRSIAPTPEWLLDSLLQKQARAEQYRSAREQAITDNNLGDIMRSIDDALKALKMDIAEGGRNNTLFRNGAVLYLHGYVGWQIAITEAASRWGIGDAELERIIDNIGAYAKSSESKGELD